LKVLHPRLTAAVEARQRFEREIRILGSLRHPGVVMATDAGRIGSAAYLVMEFIDGIDLARLVRRSGPLSIAEACSVGRGMAEAIAAAHRAGVVHRDVKPSNVMLDRAGEVKLLDFGLAHLATLTADDPETSLGRLLGTLEYMAPEQAGPERLVGPAVDLYGLGATLFFLLTGRSPRGTGARRSLLEQLRSLSEEQPADIRALRADGAADPFLRPHVCETEVSHSAPSNLRLGSLAISQFRASEIPFSRSRKPQISPLVSGSSTSANCSKTASRQVLSRLPARTSLKKPAGGDSPGCRPVPVG
jgi:serine/threonine protein kinase